MLEAKGFKAVKRAVIAALEEGRYQHEARAAIEVKNLLATGEVSASAVVEVIRRSDGTCHQCTPLHQDPSIDCHLIRANGWYLKFYFLDPSTVFISVHR